MRTRLLDIVRCPLCNGAFQLHKIEERAPDWVEHGHLECSDCQIRYPIVAGIPILRRPDGCLDIKQETNDLTVLNGPLPKELLKLQDNGKPAAAFAALLNPLTLNGNLLAPLQTRNGKYHNKTVGPITWWRQQPVSSPAARFRRLAQRRFGRHFLPQARSRLADFLRSNESDLSALEVIDLYYRKYSGSEMFNYFAFRIGQPRHLAALSVARSLTCKNKPLLDVACGVGHLEHYLTNRNQPSWVIGFDRDFFRLYIASKYVAPKADYVCAEADSPLPFRSDCFDGAICSDAFHYFVNRSSCVRELRRVVSADGVLIFTRIGNVSVEPREGYELNVPGYRRLFGELEHFMVGEDELVKSYLGRRAPNPSVSDAELEKQKWVSVVAARSCSFFDSRQRYDDWPHAVGSLRLNPLYVVEDEASGDSVPLRFEFPSFWYEREDCNYLDYAPRKCMVGRKVFNDLEQGKISDDVASLISKMVVLGFPERYLS